MTDKFTKSLLDKDLSTLCAIEKGDLHNHVARGGNISMFKNFFDISLLHKPKVFNGYMHMEQWYQENISKYFDASMYPNRIKYALETLVADGVKVAVLTYGNLELELFESIEDFVELQKKLYEAYAPKINIIPEIGINSNCDIETFSRECEDIFKFDFFKSIDIHGRELTDPTRYKKLFKKADKYGLKLRAHVGEQGNAEIIKKTIECLELNEINHGNQANFDIGLMRLIKRKNIRLNMCPESNIQLSLYPDIKKHPIKELYDFGICVTINTDDMLIFDKSISQMFLEFYDAGIFSAYELNEIRKNALWV